MCIPCGGRSDPLVSRSHLASTHAHISLYKAMFTLRLKRVLAAGERITPENSEVICLNADCKITPPEWEHVWAMLQRNPNPMSDVVMSFSIAKAMLARQDEDGEEEESEEGAMSIRSGCTTFRTLENKPLPSEDVEEELAMACANERIRKQSMALRYDQAGALHSDEGEMSDDEKQKGPYRSMPA